MSRTFKHRGFTDIRGADAGGIHHQKATVELPAFATKGILTISGSCMQNPANKGVDQTWPDMVLSLNHEQIGRAALVGPGDFHVTFNIEQARNRHGLTLEFSLRHEQVGKILSLIYRINSTYRRRMRRISRAGEHDVHIHKIMLDDRVLVDFTFGASTFLPDYSLRDLGMGMNIVGFFQHEFGIGESARCCANAAKAAGIPIALNPVKIGTGSLASEVSWSDCYQPDNPHPVNVFHLDPPQMKMVEQYHGSRFMPGKYNIGYWAWELPEFPDYWLSNFSHVDEVWVPSEFVRQAVGEKSPVPVLVMPHAIEFEIPENVTRARFGLPEGAFLFLIMYDLNSTQERKNPYAAIRAFQSAFPNSGNVKLVVKIHHADKNPDDFLALQESLKSVPDVILINQTLSHNELRALQNLCDCFVSLHRSEGFGMGLAECMFLGKSVIATNWSGNLEFMDAGNACMVDYELVELKETSGPYKKGQKWAAPDEQHAASWMKKIVEDPVFRGQICLKAKAKIKNDLSRLRIGSLYERRLRTLFHWL